MNRPVVLGAVGLVGLHAIAVYLVPQAASSDWVFLRRTWGFHFWTYYPVWAALAAYTIALLAAAPSGNQLLANALAGLAAAATFGRGRVRKRFLFAAFVPISWVLFYVFRQKYGFLGDGYVRASDVEAGRIASEGVLSMQLQIGFHGLLRTWGWSAVDSIQMFSCFWGGVYVYLVCLLADRLGADRFEKLVVVGLLVSIGPIQFFFGYIETYAPVPAFLLGFVVTGLSALRREASAWWPTLWVIAGVAMHVLLATLLPALLYILYVSTSRRSRGFARSVPYLAGVTGVAVSALWLLFFQHLRPGTDKWLPVFPTHSRSQAILSASHL